MPSLKVNDAIVLLQDLGLLVLFSCFSGATKLAERKQSKGVPVCRICTSSNALIVFIFVVLSV